MPNFSKTEVILVQYPFSDLTASKIRPATVIGRFPQSPDHLIVPLTSKTAQLAAGEFVLTDWRQAGLHLPTAVKRGIFTIHERLIVKSVGKLSAMDSRAVEQTLRQWLELP
jgi:mRNA interferase MazF